MDKITAGIIDKLSIIGFFNVILSGGVLLYGISPVLDQYVPGFFYSQLGLESDFEKGIVICLLCYVFGCALQSIQELLFRGVQTIVVGKCLSSVRRKGDQTQEKSVLDNKYQRKGIIKQAEKLFSVKDLGKFDPGNKDMCSYFIGYCEQSNSIKGYNSKSSRLSESATFYEQLAVAFYVLAVVGLLIMIFAHNNVLLYCLIYLVMGSIFTGKAYQSRLSCARAVLSTYEVVTDQEMQKKA